jgi:hypothetical protein
LRTTLIVGFPGETDADYAELDGFVADTGFDHVGVFTYSHEEGTRAFGLADDVPAAVKRRRRNLLMGRQKKIVARAQKGRIGSEVAVLIDGPSAEHDLVLQGRLEGQAPDIDPVVFLTDCDPGAYGTRTVYLLPKARVVLGQQQISARINQDPTISQQLTLWNQPGVSVVFGNMLVLPVERSVAYIQPMFLQAQNNAMSQLVSVIAVNGDRVEFDRTLAGALAKAYAPQAGSDAASTTP